MIPFQVLLIAVAISLGVGGTIGYRWSENNHKGEVAAAAIEAAGLSSKQRSESSKVETVYVDRIQKIEVPVDRVVTRIQRAACRVQPEASSGGAVPSGNAAESPDVAAAADPDAGLLEGIAVDAEACLRNAQQLASLQELVRANSAAK